MLNKLFRSDTGALFQQLGMQVEKQWSAHDYRHEALPGIAVECLDGSALYRQISHSDLYAWILSNAEMPYQQSFDSPFGEPPVTLYWNSRFYIEALFWDTATPSIHNHTFWGAFSVLSGSSLHTSFTFNESSRVNDELRIGDLQPVASEILEPGHTEDIRPRDALIHSVYHLESPSVTVVIRTHSEVNKSDRFEYLPPGMAVDPTFVDQRRIRRLQILALMQRTDPRLYLKSGLELLRTSDVLTAFCVMRQAICGRAQLTDANPMSELFMERWPSFAPLALEALNRLRKRQWAVRLRAHTTDRALRTLLGLLASYDSWGRVRSALVQLYPSEPPESAALRLTKGLADAKILESPMTAEQEAALAGWLRSPQPNLTHPWLLDLRNHAALWPLVAVE